MYGVSRPNGAISQKNVRLEIIHLLYELRYSIFPSLPPSLPPTSPCAVLYSSIQQPNFRRIHPMRVTKDRILIGPVVWSQPILFTYTFICKCRRFRASLGTVSQEKKASNHLMIFNHLHSVTECLHYVTVCKHSVTECK